MSDTILLSTDPARAFNDLWRRLGRLEQGITSPDYTGAASSGGNEFETIVVGPPGSQVTLDTVILGPPTGITADPGAFHDRSFVDVEWDAVTNAGSYQVELAINTAGVRSIVDQKTGIQRNARFDNLDRTKDYSVRVATLNRVGLTGAFSAWVDFEPVYDAFAPAAPTGVAAARGASSLIVRWNRNTEPDVDNGHGIYIVQLSTTSIFTVVLSEARISGTVHVFSGLDTQTTYYARVAAIDSSGNQGAWSANASMIVGGITGSMVLADQIITSHMQVNTINGDRILANSLIVEKLAAGTIAAKTITLGAGGQFKAGGAPTSTGMLINDQGISLYSGSTRTVYLDALTGSATFTGTVSGSTVTGSTITGGSITGTTIQTAASGARIVMLTTLTGSGSGAYADLEFHSARVGDDYQPSSLYAYQITDPTFGLYHQFTISGGRLINDAFAPVIFLTSRTHSGFSVSPSQVIAEAEIVRLGYNVNRRIIVGTADAVVYGKNDTYLQATSSGFVKIQADADSYLYMDGNGGANYLLMANQDNQYLEMGSSYMQWKHLSGARVYVGALYVELFSNSVGLVQVGSNYVNVTGDGDTYMNLTGGTNTVFIQGQPNAWIQISGGAMYNSVTSGNYWSCQSDGLSLIRARRSAGYGDIQLQGLFNSSTDPLLRINTSSWQVFYDSSSERLKQDVRPLSEVYDIGSLIDRMAPIAYKEKDFEGNTKPHDFIGLSAEKLHEVAPQLVCLDQEGAPNSILYDKLAVVALAGVQDLRARVAALELMVKELTKKK